MKEEKSNIGILLIVLVLSLGLLAYVLTKDNNQESTALETMENDSALEQEAGIQDTTTKTSDSVVEKTYVPQETVITPPPTAEVVPEAMDPGITIVTYRDSGFIPPVVEVTAGESVTFINSSSKPMWVTSEDHPTAKAQLYRGFDQGKSVPSGGTYNFSFLKVGVWGYKNLNADNHLGAVSVVPQ